MKNELDRYKDALSVAIAAIDGLSNWEEIGNIATTALDKINSLLHPPPEMETVEVIKWVPFNSAGVPSSNVLYDTEDAAKFASHCKGQAVKTVGTYQRPKPQKVERSVSIENIHIYNDGQIHELQRKIVFRGGCENKTGTLTFTWEE